MSEKKIIAVFGATGAQGGGLARAILNDSQSEFSVRAITRDTSSAKAQELAQMGAEVVAADIDDAESLKGALQGVYGAYFVTFFWAHFSPEKEMAEAQNLAKAAKECGVQHAVWSTLEDTRQYVPLTNNQMPTLMGNYKVPHFDAKGESNHYFTDYGVPTTFLLTSFYWENLIYFGMGPKKDAAGKLGITYPLGDKKMAGIGAEDIGRCAYGIFKKGPALIGKTIGIAGELLSGAEMAQGLTKALNQEVVYHEIAPETFRNLGFPGADDLGNMFQFYRDYEEVFAQSRDVTLARELNPALQTFEAWLQENAPRLPLD